jgi:hypothetical protein
VSFGPEHVGMEGQPTTDLGIAIAPVARDNISCTGSLRPDGIGPSDYTDLWLSSRPRRKSPNSDSADSVEHWFGGDDDGSAVQRSRKLFSTSFGPMSASRRTTWSGALMVL